MRFQKELYRYQLDILDVFEKEVKRGDKKIHIVAPPGSGKTIVGLEMITRLDAPTLILVPNLTLQEQWHDKIATMFLDAGEDIGEIVSTSPDSIKRINIITYQSLAQTQNETDGVLDRILERSHRDFREEFPTLEEFVQFTILLKENDSGEYHGNIKRYRKLLKISGSKEMIHELLSERVMAYFASLKSYGIRTLVVDEAHHLTAWWSRVIFSLYDFLGNAHIVGLTATPPFDDIDFFDLDDSYADLLGEVDYYIPTPAIIKSGKLAPYSDLAYFVKPDDTLRKILSEKELALRDFLKTHGGEIGEYLLETVKEDFEKLQAKSMGRLNGYLRFIHVYHPESDISEYVSEYTFVEINLEDIAKSVGKWLSAAKLDTDSKKEIAT
jgi:superfamily II DNA or RNA helicase